MSDNNDLHQAFKETLRKRKNGGESKAKGSHRTLEMPFMWELPGELFSMDFTDQEEERPDE